MAVEQGLARLAKGDDKAKTVDTLVSGLTDYGELGVLALKLGKRIVEVIKEAGE